MSLTATLTPPPPPSAAAMPRLRVLCVDDEPRVLDSLAYQLRAQYDVLTATGGVDGLELLHRYRDIAVLISDMRMPVTDGAAFLRLARDIAPDTARILLTGHADTQSSMNAVNQGQISAYLLKPCSPRTLLNAVSAAASRYRLSVVQRMLLAHNSSHAGDGPTDVSALFERAAALFGCRYAALALYDRNDASPRQVLTRNLEASMMIEPSPLFDRLLHARAVVQESFTPGRAPVEGLPQRHPPVTQLLGAPLSAFSAQRGWLCFSDSRPTSLFMADDVQVITVLARLCGDLATRDNGSARPTS